VYFCTFQSAAQRKQSHDRRNCAQFGHLAWHAVRLAGLSGVSEPSQHISNLYKHLGPMLWFLKYFRRNKLWKIGVFDS
jgi:hypothetical protein